MNQNEAKEALDKAQVLAEQVGVYIDEQPEGSNNGIILLGALGIPEDANAVHYVGFAAGNTDNLINTLASAMEMNPELANVIQEAVRYYVHRKTCDCPDCRQRRLNNAMNNPKNLN